MQFLEVQVSHLTCHALAHNPARGFVVIVDITMKQEDLPQAAKLAQRMQASRQDHNNNKEPGHVLHKA